LLVAAVIVVQPFVLGPSSAGDNESRLAALALPALAVAAGALLAHVRLEGRETAVLVGAIALAGLHPRYTWPPPYSSAVWAALVLVAALLVLATGAGTRSGLGSGRTVRPER
jgi:peptidoglycan/LPS O-acetylase OafA/YrhL